MRKIGIAVLLIVMAMGMLIPAAHASSPTSIFTASVTAPSYSATNTSITVWVNDSVGFRDYALQVIFYGQNLTGMSPSGTYYNSSANTSDFRIPVKTPDTGGGVLYLYIETWARDGSSVLKYTTTISIQVVQPYVLNAVINNPENVPIDNVTVYFYVDNTLVGSKVVNLSPDSTTTVRYDWIIPYPPYHPADGGAHTQGRCEQPPHGEG
ncbi:hypothetical protein [Thermogymnomonas acidicola]|uniref:hypothetical protein n=1 Tax=Thermogymnomonas acidicola TaxID=399579 RepID=UPI000946289E|nr:hypothetical protein [Thermogymnomonas acidicola]